MPHNDHTPAGSFCHRTRREFLWQAGGGFTGLAMTGLLSLDGFFNSIAQAANIAANPLAAKKPHFAPKAKSVIFLFMYGGPSHVDTFDCKPALYPLDGKTIEVRHLAAAGKRTRAAWSGRSGSSSRTGSAASK